MAENNYKTMSDERLKEIARRRHYIKRGFFYHLGIFLVISAALVVIYLLTGKGYLWPIWPIGVWSLFVITHLFSTKRSLNKIDGKPNAIDAEMDRLRKK
jgi:hypothetical protein